jgi:hypothetical protein
MGTQVTAFNPAKLPSFAKKRSGPPSALTKALAGGGGGGYPRKISIKGGVFRLIADGKEVAAIEERYLDVVLVNAAPTVSRAYYAKKFKDAENSPPVCWSDNGDVPDATVPNPQHDNCAKCPMNIKGSGEGDTRACRFNQRIAVVLANDMQGEIMQLTIPAKSLFGKEDNGNFPLQAYARWLSAQGIEPNEVITRMKFDTKEESPKLFFKTMRWLEDEEFEMVGAQCKAENATKAIEAPTYGQSGTKQLAAPKDDDEEFETKKKPAPKDDEEDAPPPPPAKKKAAPADDEEDAPPPPPAKKKAAPADEEVPEPTKKKAAPAPAERKNLGALVSDWDTDD